MDLIPPRDVPKPKLREILKAVGIGALLGTALGALLAYLADEPALLIAGPFAGALVGLGYGDPPNVLWNRRE